MEDWRPVPGYENYYEVSSEARVRRIGGRVLKPWRHRDGYLNVGLSTPALGLKIYFLHRVVALAFLGPSPVGYTVNHKDGNKLNNLPDNLEYMTLADNIRHSLRNGIPDKNYAHGVAVASAKLTDEKVREIRRLSDDGVRSRIIAREFGASDATISAIVNRKSWKHVA